MLFQDLSLELIQKSIFELRQANEETENTARERLKDFYEDRQIRDEYLGDFGFKTDEGKYLVPMVGYNVTKKVIDKISLLYKKPPEYDDDIYAEWNAEFPDFYLAKKTAERYKNLLHNVLLRPVIDNNQRFVYIETDYMAHFTDKNKLVPFGYSIPIKHDTTNDQNPKPILWVFWSDEFYFFYDADGKVTPDEAYPAMNNPYLINPCVELVKSYPVDEYGGMVAQSLIDGNQTINIAMANLNLMIHHQAFDQPYVSGIDMADAKNMTASTRLWFAPEGTNFCLLGYSPKIMEAIEAIKFQIIVISDNYNVNINWSIEGDVASGVALKIRNIDLIEALEDDAFFAIAAEKKLYKVIKAQQEIHKLKEPKLKEEDISVNFYDIKFPLSIDEQIKKDDHELKHNVISLVDIMQRYDPDLSDEDAIEKINENKKINGNLTRADIFKQAAEEVVPPEEVIPPEVTP